MPGPVLLAMLISEARGWCVFNATHFCGFNKHHSPRGRMSDDLTVIWLNIAAPMSGQCVLLSLLGRLKVFQKILSFLSFFIFFRLAKAQSIL